MTIESSRQRQHAVFGRVAAGLDAEDDSGNERDRLLWQAINDATGDSLGAADPS